MAIVEKVFYVESKEDMENDVLKKIGYNYEGASTLGIDKPGFYMVIKTEESEFEKEEIKKALENMKELESDEKEKVLKKISELEDSAAGGIALFD